MYFCRLKLFIMAIIHIETATTVCSVALSEKGEVIFEKVSFDGLSHASLLGVFVGDAVKESKSMGLPIDAVAVSGGPGSYTGLRIGVSMAKGLCFGWNVPLISIPTLEIMASRAIKQVSGNDLSDSLFCAMIDARRMEVYAAIYDGFLRKIRDTEAEVITKDSYTLLLEKRKMYFFGNGALKCKDIIQSSNAFFIDDIYPDFIFLSNSKRYGSLYNELHRNNTKVIATSNITSSSRPFDYILNYESFLDINPVIVDNALAIVLNLLNRALPNRIILAGFDGFSEKVSENYYDEYMEWSADYKRLILVNEALKNKISCMLTSLEITFITPSLYKG